MCDRCRVEATGLRSGKGTAIFSKLFGLYACNHSKECECDECEKYRHKNKYADTGIFLNREKVE